MKRDIGTWRSYYILEQREWITIDEALRRIDIAKGRRQDEGENG